MSGLPAPAAPPRRRWGLQPAGVLAVQLVAACLWWPQAAVGQAAPAPAELPSPSALADYAAKLEVARGLQSQMSGRVACIESHHAELLTRGRALEDEIGTLRRQEEELNTQLRVKTEEERLLGIEIQNARAARDRLMAEAARSREIAKTALMWGGGRGGSSTYLQQEAEARRMDQQIQGLEARLGTLRGNVSDVQAALARAMLGRKGVEERIGGAEAQMKQVKATQASLLSDRQAFRLLIDEFANELKKAASFDTGDASARAARQLARLSAEVDASIVRGQAAVAAADALLPDPNRPACAAA